MTLRSDFESFIALEPALQQWMEQARVQLLPLSASEMREAIERPADLVGLKFEPGVVEALLHDTLGEPAALPLLQFSLLKLWDARDRNRVTWQAYQQIGGGRQALARSADALYNSLIPEDQVTARRILLRMVRPGEGLEITSNRIRRDQLYRAGEARDRVDRVLERLVAARLVRLTPGDTPGSAQVEIAHEALVRNWPTLVGWLEDERAAIATRRRLEAKAAEWVRLGGGAAGLLDEVQLAEAERWLNSAEAAYLGFDEALLDLVIASRTAIDQARHAQEDQRRRELEQMQALAEARRLQAEQNEKLAIEQSKRAEAEARSARRLRLIVATLTVALIGAIMSGILLLQQQSQIQERTFELATQVSISDQAAATARIAAANAQAAAATSQAAESLALLRGTQAALAAAQESQARQTAEALVPALERQARQARAGQLAALAQAKRDERPILSLLLAIEAVHITLQKGEAPVPVADAALRDSLTRIGGIGLLIGEPVVAAATSDDGRVAVAMTANGILSIWNLTDPGLPPRVVNTPGSPTLLVLSRDGARLATTGADPTSVRLWDLSGTMPVARELAAPGGINTALAISDNGRQLAIGDDQGVVLVYDLTNPSATPQRLSGLGGRSAVRSLAFSPDGQLLATGNADSQARLYNLASGSGSYTRERTSGALTSITFSNNGRWIVYGSAGGQVRLWSVSGAQFDSAYVLLGLTAGVTDVSIAPGDGLIIAGSADGTTCIWDLEARSDNRARVVLRGQTARITGLALNGNASRLATAGADGRIALWNLTAADPGVNPLIMRGHDGPVNDVAIPARTSLMLTVGADGMARVWNLDAPLYALKTLPQESVELLEVACRAAGRTLSESEWSEYVEGLPYNPFCK
jgi:WD40 repeat protein